MTDIHTTSSFKQKAVALRRKGFSYSEILREVPVAKSTLGAWLHNVGLSKIQRQRLTDKKLASARRGGAAKHAKRLAAIDQINAETAKDITNLSARDLFLIGIALYWAEGSKEKESRPGTGIIFSNSDPRMIKLFLRWLSDACAVSKNDIIPEIYIHKSAVNSVSAAIHFWASATGMDEGAFTRVYFKQNNISTKRKRTGSDYFGLLRIKARRSSVLNRRVSGWINAIMQCMV